MPRRLTAGVCAAALAVQMGCYTYMPPQDAVPVAGKDVAVELNARGRSLVGGQLGETVAKVEGKIVGATDSEVTLSVSRTILLQGSSAAWTGENVSVPREGVQSIRIRQFSRGKTVMASAGFIIGIVAIGVGISLITGGFGRGDDTGQCTTGCGQSIRQQ